jgi:tetratricopeptide (TPR) repeat protein/transcriptional regulator with XRE-family HTH domain
MSGERDIDLSGLRAAAMEGIDSLEGLSNALRQLRRRHARRSGDSPLTYREVAAKTGWALGTVGEYFSGKSLPSTDRLDILVRLLGANPAEQGMLATARDQVEERRRHSAAPAAQPPQWAVPNQLPATTRHFTGREEHLARLVQPPGGASVYAVDGMAGSGKTALAVAAARQLTEAGRYPDGTLFVDLYGYSGRQPTTPAEALEALLRGLGVPGPQIPEDPDARAGLYRTVTAQRRVLIVLDNARDEAQVRPLLPGTPTCLVLVTSRRRMAGLDDAEHLTLGVLPRREAVELFQAMARVPGDLPALEEIVELCGLLPLAVRIAATRLKTSAALDGRTLLEQLRAARDQESRDQDGGGQDQDRLRVLHDGERSVLAALEVSYRHLPPEQQQAFGALGLHPGIDFEPYATAALLGTGDGHARSLLEALEQVNLLDQRAAGRYRFHDLTRLYATSRAVPMPLDRLYDHYARTATAAMDLAYPYEADRRPAAIATPGRVPAFADRAAALAWLESEHANLVATALHAADHGRPDHAMRQAAALYRHFAVRGVTNAEHSLNQIVAELARTAGDRPVERTALIRLAWVHRLQGRYDQAEDCLVRATDIARATGDVAGEVDGLIAFGHTYFLQGAYEPAAESQLRALELSRRSGNLIGEGKALYGLGIVHRVAGRYPEATEHLTRALEIARAKGDPIGEVSVLAGLSQVRHETGDQTSAYESFHRVLDLATALGDRNWQYEAHLGIGSVERARGRLEAAGVAYQRALDLAEGLSQAGDQVRAHDGLARVELAFGRVDGARRHWRRALEILDSIRAQAAEDVSAAQIQAALDALPRAGGGLMRRAE